jgi:hypothetical protein
MLVVVLDVDSEDSIQVRSPDDQQPVQTFGADRAYPALGVRVRIGCLYRRAQHVGAFRAEHLVERAGELGVPVVE